MESLLRIAGFVIFPSIGGSIGGLITRKKIKTWFNDLDKPSWRPPNWAFGPVWTTLYSAMGYASYLVWRDGGGFDGPASFPLSLYGAQLAMNWMWTPLFFGLEQTGFAFVWLVALDVGIVATMVSFRQINQTAFWLLAPYLAWSSFAAVLNFEIWRRNPSSNWEDDSLLGILLNS